MKKAYTTPTILVHGNVHMITAASQDDDREDRIFNAAGNLADTGQGYLDQCFFVPETERCVLND